MSVAEYMEITLEVLLAMDFFEVVSSHQSLNLQFWRVKRTLVLPGIRSQDVRMDYLYLSGKQRQMKTTYLSHSFYSSAVFFQWA